MEHIYNEFKLVLVRDWYDVHPFVTQIVTKNTGLLFQKKMKQIIPT
jgi:hypothetical protein